MTLVRESVGIVESFDRFVYSSRFLDECVLVDHAKQSGVVENNVANSYRRDVVLLSSYNRTYVRTLHNYK